GGVPGVASAERAAGAARGSGSTLGLGHSPRALHVVLDVSGLAAIGDYVPEDMVVGVGAGMTLGGLAARLAGHGQRLALDPIQSERGTLRGGRATHAARPL